MVNELRKNAAASGIYHPLVATAIAALGDVDGAIEWLEASYAQRHPNLHRINVDAGYGVLRSDQRFRDLLRRIGFGG